MAYHKITYLIAVDLVEREHKFLEEREERVDGHTEPNGLIDRQTDRQTDRQPMLTHSLTHSLTNLSTHFLNALTDR